MALTVTSRGTGTHNTGAGTLVPGGRSATLAVGSMGVLCIALDNAGAAGAALIAPATWTDAKGNVWTLRQNALYDNGAASAGVEMAIYTAPITVALLTGDLGTITWASGSPVAKAWTWYEVIPVANAQVEYSTGGTIAGATAANGQVVTASVPVGDAVIAGYFAEGVAAVTQDADATNGSWAAQQTATIGATTSGVRIATQAKVQTTTASTQSYDPTVASQDRIAGYIRLHEGRTAEASVTATGAGAAAATASTTRLRTGAMTGGGAVTPSLTTARTRSGALTGGGVLTATQTTARSRAVTDTGGGIATTAQSTVRPVSAVATGAGIATVDAEAVSIENADVSVTATGAGVVTISAVRYSPASLAATGAGALSVVATTSRAGVITATGGGVAATSVLAARQLAALLSGGGVLVATSTTARQVSPASTGGGVAVIDADGPNVDVDVSVTATGGGVATVLATTARWTTATATGGGAIFVVAVSPRLVSVIATGGGRLTLDSGIPPVGLTEDLVVAVGMDVGPTFGSEWPASDGALAFDPIAEAEVTIQ